MTALSEWVNKDSDFQQHSEEQTIARKFYADPNKNKRIYHYTDMDNLDSILKSNSFYLALIVEENYGLQLDNDSLFLFCGSRTDRFKGLYWDGEGFVLLYKRFENGNLRWPRHRNDAVNLTPRQIKQLLQGISPLPVKRVKPAIKGTIY